MRRFLPRASWGAFRGWERWTLLLGATLMTFLVLANDWGVLTPDTKPEIFLDPWQTVVRYAAAWTDTPSLGAPNFNVGVAPVAAVLGAMESLGSPPWLAMRLWRLLLLMLAAWGARRCFDILVTPGETNHASGTPGHLAVGRVVAMVAYVANPYVMLGGATTPTLLPYALLPWLVVAWIRGARVPTWRTAAMAAVVLAAMSGLNAGVVAIFQLLIILPLGIHGLIVERWRVRNLIDILARTGLIYAGLSLYWLLPAIRALGVGTAVANTTETLESINTANGFVEVIRGLGFWPLYGGDNNGPFVPDTVSLLTGTVVVALSFGWPALALAGVWLSDTSARLFAASSLVLGALVMVGVYPYDHRTWWGRALAAVLDHVPGAIAFRTTNKIGALLCLGLALLAGAGVAELSRRASRWTRPAVLVVVGAIAVGSVWPAFTGNLFQTRIQLPDYWKEAAASINHGDPATRVLTVPGTGLANYTWGYKGPDELGSSLFRRASTFRSVTPGGSAYAANLMAGVDQRLYEGTLPPGTVSALARSLGVGTVVGRYDMPGATQWAAKVESALRNDGGLGPPREFGTPIAKGGPVAISLQDLRDPAAPAQALPMEGSLLVDGDGASLPDLVGAGLRLDNRTMLLAGSTPDDVLTTALQERGRVVLTDSNLRQGWHIQRPAGTGPVVSTSEDPGPTRALFTASEQSVRVDVGSARLSASGPGMIFGPDAVADPGLAFDGDQSTTWRFGNFGRGVGNALTVSLARETSIPSISLWPAQDGGNAITRVKVSTVTREGRRTAREQELGLWASFPTTIDLSADPVMSLTIEVVGSESHTSAPLGFREITIPGVAVDRPIRLPIRFSERLAELSTKNPALLSSTPVDVILHRLTDSGSALGSGESRIHRVLSLPVDRTFRFTGTARLASTLPDDGIDELLGSERGVTASSTSRAFDNPGLRASAAIDGSPGLPNLLTSWVPADPVLGESIVASFPAQPLTEFSVDQPDSGRIITRVLVSVNEGAPFEATLQRGHSLVRLPQPEVARSVRVLIAATEGEGFARISDLGLPRVQAGDSLPTGCVPVLDVDGQTLMATVTGSPKDLLSGGTVRVDGCDETVLATGTHQVTSMGALSLDTLHLTDGKEAAAPNPVAAIRNAADAPGRVTAALPAGCDPCVVSTGQGFDKRWSATVNGRDLGEPIVVNGYAVGWVVRGAEGAVFEASFVSALFDRMGWWLSGATLLGAFLLILIRRRSPSAGPSDPPEPVGSELGTVTDVAEGATERVDTLGLRPEVWAGMALLWGLGVVATIGVWTGLVALCIGVATWALRSRRPLHWSAAAALLVAAVMRTSDTVIGGGDWADVVHRLQNDGLAHASAGLALWLLGASAVIGVLGQRGTTLRGRTDDVPGVEWIRQSFGALRSRIVGARTPQT